MRQFLTIILCFALLGLTYGQDCKCIDNIFSSAESQPIALSKIGNKEIAFCGFHYDDIGVLGKDSSFVGCGYEVILCYERKSIFEAGEYYTDSIKINRKGFEIYRLSNFPTLKSKKYTPIPLLLFTFRDKNDRIMIDTTLSIDEKYFSSTYLNNLKEMMNAAIEDSSNSTAYQDLRLHYLFLKAIKDEKHELEFIKSGPYDGYMGPIYNDFIKYLGLKRKPFEE